MHIILADASLEYHEVVKDYVAYRLPEARLTAVTSAEQVLDVLDQEAADLVITAQRLPKMTGLDLVSVLRQRWPSLPIIFHTVDASLERER